VTVGERVHRAEYQKRGEKDRHISRQDAKANRKDRMIWMIWMIRMSSFATDDLEE